MLPCIENGYKVQFVGINVNGSILSSSTRGNLKAPAFSPPERVQEPIASAKVGQRSSWGTGQGSFSKILRAAASRSGCQDASRAPKAPIGGHVTQMPAAAPSMPSDREN